MFTDLSDAELAALIVQLRTAVLALAMGQQQAEIRYGEQGEKFHPSNPVKTEEFLNSAIAERDRRAGICRRGAIFPVTG